MKYARKERIGNADLFTGREKDITYFLNWINSIKSEKSKSTAILARRKMGKTALLERLFNITFEKNDGIIPFYYEVKEIDMHIVDFSIDFFLTFIYQYIAFKTRKDSYLRPLQINLANATAIAKNEGLDYVVELIEGVEYVVAHDHADFLWNYVRNIPKTVAESQKEFIVQMID